MRHRCLVFLVWLVGLGHGAALGQTSTPGGEATGLADTRWVLTRLVADEVECPLEHSATTLHFASAGQLDGRAAVNGYQGQYAADSAGNLRWPTPIRSTRMGGTAPLPRLESTYLAALAKANRWQLVTGPELRLSTADGRTVLTFRAQTNP